MDLIYRGSNKFYRHIKFIKVTLSYAIIMNICHVNVKIAKLTKYHTYNKKTQINDPHSNARRLYETSKL